MARSPKPSRITRQKTCCASESNTSVRVVFANCSGFDVPIGVVKAWEERGSFLNLFRTTTHGRISETFTNYEAQDLLRNSGFYVPIGVVKAWKERGSCHNILRTTIRGRISETFTNYEAKDLLRKHGRSMDHVLTYSKRKITVRSQKPSRNSRQKTCCPSESNTSVRVVFANRSGFDAPIGVFMEWEDRGSSLNIFLTTNRGRMSETFTNYEAKDLLRKNLYELRGKRLVAQLSKTRRFALCLGTGVDLMLELESSRHGWRVDHVLTYFGRQITVESQKPSRITRQKTCCASESNTSVRVVFANWSGFDAPIGVVIAWEDHGSCLNLFRTTNRGQLLETYTNFEANHLFHKHGRSVDHVLTYSGRQITVGSQKPSRISRQKNCCTCESNTSVRVVFANRSGFDAPIGVVMAWEDHGSCLIIFRTINQGRISETFTNFEAKHLFRKNLHELRGKTLVAQVTETRRSMLFLRTVVDLMFQLESSWHGRSMDHVFTYSGRQITIGSQKPSRITRQKTCCASESNTSVRVAFANRSGFDAGIGIVKASKERGSCLNIFLMT
ncbi:uncharacterized protein G2W53_009873 [Senna tora]|uniref:Uncharacterized protein n=1 Tax=Senna tora TaxID=362788 RepID=A0A834WYV1_9FABA|nr:uncharacterized protein G2W53_009873 [Senna tora]